MIDTYSEFLKTKEHKITDCGIKITQTNSNIINDLTSSGLVFIIG